MKKPFTQQESESYERLLYNMAYKARNRDNDHIDIFEEHLEE